MSNPIEKYNKYIDPRIQLDRSVIDDILKNIEGKKMLIFGLGYDSNLWFRATDNNAFFIEHDDKYIKYCVDNTKIGLKNIVKHSYSNISVKGSLSTLLKEPDSRLDELYPIPDDILKLGQFDIILVDGPCGYEEDQPGRLLPIYWSFKYLSKPNTLIYIDDTKRELERLSISRFVGDKTTTNFPARLGSTKILI